MKSILYITLSLFTLISLTQAQNDVDFENSFRTHLAYYNSTKIAEGNNLVYVVTNGSLLSYNKTDNSVIYYSRQTGLSDNAITNIAYNPKTNSLIIVYKNGNIDLMSENGSVYNISHLLNNSSFIIKDVNNIDIFDDIAYLSMQFGVIALDMNKKEIKDTYRIINNAVYSVSLFNNELYATTINGLYKGSINSNLVDITNWSSYNPSLPNSTDTIIKSVVFNNNLCFLSKNNKVRNIYRMDNNATIHTLLTDNTIENLKVENGKLIAHSKTKAYLFSSFANPDKITDTINDITSLKDPNIFWVATGSTIMKGIKKNNSGSYDIILSELNKEGPRDNTHWYMTTYKNQLLTVKGGFLANSFQNLGIFSIYEDGNWFNFDESKVQYGPSNYYKAPKDFTSIACIDTDPVTYYIGSYGNGLLEIKGEEVKVFNIDNSQLETASISNKYGYIRISGLAVDKNNNLWITNPSPNNAPIKVLKPDGTWVTFAFKGVFKNSDRMDKIMITSKDHKWLNLPYNIDANPGLFIFKDNNLSEEGSESVYVSNLITADGNSIGASTFRCMVEDKKGNVWVGTNKGPVYTPVPANALENPSRFYFNQIIRQNEGGNYIFLNNEQVNTIAVDGGNRKWIGTESTGVFLVNEDGTETVYNFTTENSPLPSNKITSLAINQLTGEVFIGTNNGLVSFMSEGSEGKDNYSEVSAYPNPVRPEDHDKVTITGLMTDSNVKITDISGNLIYQAKSVGGQMIWNCRNHKGSRVATGIYLVIASNADGNESVATKIMVVK
ncbi:type IX secretion system anionic LPS delivery protein PorZ [Massilibacteroides vaginae]|uniref:type IX secretion system anionic LPS delivery protein PorZ n=1 Tax=Massilibacteroides vaginae TaxID=1673718 RepID=UPI001594A192|nr:two-component regulator propeller domain-containing protein [Massilibacteroides vaginae]